MLPWLDARTHLKAEPLVDELVQAGLAFSSDGRLKMPLALAALHEPNPDLVKVYEGSLGRVVESRSI